MSFEVLERFWEAEVAIWLVATLGGLFFAIVATRTAYGNWRYQALEPTSLRARLAAAHLRRALVKTGVQSLFVLAAVISLLGPEPLRSGVIGNRLLTGLPFILVAVILDYDLLADLQLQRYFGPLGAAR